METIEEIDYKGYSIKIYYDDLVESPREWDNLGEMICFHKRYLLGDKHNFSVEEAREYAEENISYPLYLLDHSGLMMSINNFQDPWDSGQVGWIVASKEKIRNEFNVKRISKKLEEKVKEILRNEVEIYNDYLMGNVYCYNVINKDGEIIDSCGGFYGHDFETNGLLEFAKSAIDYELSNGQLRLFDSKYYK